MRVALERVASVSRPHTNNMIAKVKFRFYTSLEESKLFSEVRQEMVSCEESHSWILPDLLLTKLFKPKLQVKQSIFRFWRDIEIFQ